MIPGTTKGDMHNMRSIKKYVVLAVGLGLIAVLAMGASSCDPNAATTSAMCAIIVGDGQEGHDASVHDVLPPNKQIHVETSERDWYVPCNSRNFIISDGETTNANGQVVGDRKQPSIAYTNTGTKVKVWTSSYWTLNQNKDVMTKFWEVCLKYNCASDEPVSGSANFSTPGWNGMLGENFGPSVDQAAFTETASFTDDIWKKHSPAAYASLGKKMSNSFSEAVRTKTGYNDNLFCGSGNSVWAGEPGDSEFLCRTVRIEVNDVEPFDATLNNSVSENTKAKQDKNVNATKLQAAIEKYGSKAAAAYWLGLQDSLAKCSPSTVCVINIGGGQTAVAVPTGKAG